MFPFEEKHTEHTTYWEHTDSSGRSLQVIPRPSYCDRGAWTWSQQGYLEDVAVPPLYFFDRTIAEQELTAWVLASAANMYPNDQLSDMPWESQTAYPIIEHPNESNAWLMLVPMDGGTKSMCLRYQSIETPTGE